jgi:FixH
MDYFSADADARIDGALTMSRALLFLILVAVALFAQVHLALADGGVVQMQRSAGQFVITVFTAPAPLRVGPADISILVQDSSNHNPVLDANVTVRLYREGGEAIDAEAGRERSKNKLLYGALLRLPEAGRWKIEVIVLRNSVKARISGAIIVAPRQPFLFAYWWTLALPPVAIGLFIINQWLKSRQ